MFQLTVVRSDVLIKSIELQLIRVETCGCAEGYARDGLCDQFLVFLNYYCHFVQFLTDFFVG